MCKHRYNYLIIVVVLTCSIVSSVSASSWYIYDMPSSVRLYGMGGAGAAVIDGNSPFYNPAQISFPENDYRLNLSLSPGSYEIYKSDDGLYHQNHANAAGIVSVFHHKSKSGFQLCHNLGFEFLRRDIYLPETTIAQPDGTGEEYQFRQDLYRLTIGFGIKKQIVISIGLSANWFKVSEENSYRTSIDVGLLVGAPFGKIYSERIAEGDHRWNFYPSIAFVNHAEALGKPMPYQTIETDKKSSRRFGFAVRASRDTKKDGKLFSSFHLLPSYESLVNYIVTSLPRYPSYKANTLVEKWHKYGIETGLYETLWLRYGYNSINESDSYSSYGFSLSTKGLLNLFFRNSRSGSQGLLGILTQKTDIRFDYANLKVDYQDKRLNFLGISLTVY